MSMRNYIREDEPMTDYRPEKPDRLPFLLTETSMTRQPINTRFWFLYSILFGLLLFWAINSFAQAATRTAVITFTRPVDYTDGTPLASTTAVTYVVYQGARGATKAKVGTISATTATISTGLQPGETCWQVSAVANGIESALSGEGCKTFTFPATNVVTITVT